MSFSINSNLGALSAYNALAKVTGSTQNAQLRLASQKRINSVSDDTSGYQVGKELQGKIAVMKGAQGNIGSAKNLLATAETALASINDLIIQIKGKIADASDPTKNKTSLANDVKALGDEISSIFTNTKFNDTQLLSGTGYSATFTFQTGESSSDTTAVNLGTLNATSLASFTGASASTISSISVTALETLVKDALGKSGNYVQRLDVKEEYLTNAIANANASVSRIFDTDMAMEQLNSTKAQVGGQVATSMLSQMNQAPGAILSLFR